MRKAVGNFFKELTLYSLAFSIALTLVMGVYLHFVGAWSEPTSVAPGGNVGAPLNTGDNTQTKGGNLVLNALGTFVTGLTVNRNLDVTNGGITTDGDVCTDLAGGKCLSTLAPTITEDDLPKGTNIGFCKTSGAIAACTSATSPATCSPLPGTVLKVCGCKSGFTLITTGIIYTQGNSGNLLTNGAYYSCIKN